MALAQWTLAPEKRRQFAIGLLGTVAIGLAVLVGVLALAQRSSPMEFSGTVLEPPKPTLPFTLRDQEGETVHWSDYRGAPVVLTFLYTSCLDTCPLVAHKLSRAYEMLGDRAGGIRFVAITVDPERETPESIRLFSEKWGMAGRWDFLTGEKEELEPLWADYWVGELRQEAIEDQSDPAKPAEGDYYVEHTSPVHLIDAEGLGRVAYSSSFTAEGLAKDIRLLLDGS